MPTNVHTDSKDLVTQCASGTVFQPVDPVFLKPKGDPGVAPHFNISTTINNAAGTVFNKNTKVATKDSYMGAGRHPIYVIAGRNTGQVHGDNGFTTWAKNLYIEGRNAVMHGVQTSVNAVWNMLPPGIKTAVQNGTEIAQGMTIKDFSDAAENDAKLMLDALMSTDTLIALVQTAALMAVATVPVIGQLAAGAAAAQRLASTVKAAGNAVTELTEMVERWSQPMSPAQIAAERKKLASFLIGVGISGILVALGRASGKLSGKSTGRENSSKEVKVGTKEAPRQTSCACATGQPVIIATGEKSLIDSDFNLPGPIPLDWRRSYRSGDVHSSWFGQGWSTPLSVQLSLAADGLTYHDAGGRGVPLPALAVGAEHFDAYEQFTLRRPQQDRWELVFKDGQTQHFERVREDLFTLPLAAIADRNGNRIAFEYPAPPDDPFDPWRPRVIVDSAGRRLRLEWNRRGLLMAVDCQVDPVAPSLTLASYTYSDDGDLVAHTDAGGARRTYEWRNNVLVAYSKADGARYCAEYDEYSPFGRVLRSYAADDGRGLRFDYNDRARTTSITDALERTTRYEYDERKDIIATTGPDGVRVATPYDSNGNPRGPVDPLGRRTQYRFDSRGNLAEVVDAAGARTAFAYNDMDLTTRFTDALNHAWLSEYDARGNLVASVDPLQHATHYAYNAQGRPVAITDARGGIKRLEWDDAGNLIAATDCSGQRTRFAYDGMGRMHTRTDALGQVTTYLWDPAGHLLELTEPGEALHRYEWSAMGHLLAYIDPLRAVTRYRYNSHGSLVEKINATGHSLQYIYDAVNRLTQLVNENGDSTHFAYDLADQLTDETGFDGRHKRYCYNAAGELTHVVEAGGSDFGPGKITHFERDALGRVTARLAEDDSSCYTRFNYDALGRLTDAINPAAEIAFAYDPLGQLLSETQKLAGAQGSAEVRILKHRYDVLGNRIQTTLPDQRSLHWLYYGSGHLHQINIEEPGHGGLHRIIADIERDALHRETGRSQGALDSHYGYDPAGHLAHHKVSRKTLYPGRDGNVVIGRDYRYDAAGNLAATTDLQRGQQTYRYDPTGRILAAKGRQDEFFAFDPAGNMLPQETQRSPKMVRGNRLNTFQDLRYTYDAHGNVITRNKGAHEQANYIWNADHQLRQATVTRHGLTQTTLYEYDPLGRRIRKIDAFGITQYLWDGDLLIESQRGKKVSLFVFEPYGFTPLATIQDDNIYWYQCDQIGVPQELTNADGAAVWAADYEIWGEATLRRTGTDDWETAHHSIRVTLNPIEQPFRFQGQQFDDETGLHYNRFRHYDPQIGRFISEDPIGLEGGNNFFQYASNPMVWIDPLGLASKCIPCRVDPCGIAAHGKQPSPRPTGFESHHGIQNEWAIANIGQTGGYTRYGGPAILLDKPSHAIVSKLQNARRDARVADGQPKWGSSLRDEFEYASKDLRAGGVSDKCRKKLLNKAYKHFYDD
ncbi:MAG: RHS repeat-associated core domain-containing protein [Pseudomonadota bacterium]